MKQRVLTLSLLLALMLTAQLASAALEFDPKTMMEVSDVHPGMIGVAKSVFAGTDITEFRVQIIDVMPQVNRNHAMILARVLDGPVVERKSSIIAGMSGSPVYIGGKLLGAIGFGWAFSREPIAGISCIRDMLEARAFMGAPPAQTAERWTPTRPLTIAGQTYNSVQVTRPGETLAAGTLALRPAGLKLSCRGLGPRSLAFLSEKLAPYGFEAVSAGGGQVPQVDVDLEPGAALAIRFAEGDIDISGVGTVTYRHGDDLLAFGHPMMQMGKVALPLATAWVHDFMPSYNDSFKLASPIADVGTLLADMPWSVGGKVGPVAPKIPARIEVADNTRKTSYEYKVQAAVLPGITPAILASAVEAAFESSYNPAAEGMVKTAFAVEGSRGAHLKRANTFYFSGSPAKPAIAEAMDIMSALEENRWQPQNVTRLDYKAEFSGGDDTAVIERVYADENVARAGKPLHLHILVRPDNAELKDFPVTLNMPLDLPKGAVRIAIGGGQDALALRSRIGLLMPEFSSLNSLLSFVEKMEDNRQLCVIAALPGTGLQVAGTRLLRLPQSIGSILEASSRTDVSRGREELAQTQELPWVVYGRQLIAMSAEDRQGAKGDVPAATTPSKTAAAADAEKDDDEKAALGGPLLPRLWWAASALKPGLSQARPLADTAVPGASATKGSATVKPATAAAAADEDKDEEGDEDDTEEAQAEAAKSVLRQPSLWTQSKGAEFIRGEAKGAGVRTDGGVTLSVGRTTLATIPEFYVWNAVATASGTYFSTSGPGCLYKVGADGKAQRFFDTGEFGVRALTADASGNLYAGTWPGGKVFRITPEGKGSLYAQLPCEYVWCLAWEGASLIAGTGPEGKVLRIGTKGEVSELAHLPQTNVLSLLVSGDKLYAATAGKGLVYRLDADQSQHVLLDAGSDDVTSLALDPAGNLYAGVAPAGKVWRVSPEGRPQVVFEDKTMPVEALAFLGGRLYMATGTEGRLLSLLEPGFQEVIYHSDDATHLTCLAADASGNLLAGTANAGSLQRFSPGEAASGTFTSTVFDTRYGSRWGAVDWQATLPAGAALSVRTRTGNSDNPDDGSWSVWSRAYDKPGEDKIDSPSARFIQYRLELSKAKNAAGPWLRRISLAYLPTNQRPKIEVSAPTLDKALRDKVEVKFAATDPDKDQMLVTVEYRPAGTGPWTSVKQLAGDKKTCEWDTSKLKDGLYDLRVKVTDALSNPGDALQAETILSGLLVDNTKPTVVWQKQDAKEGKLVLEGIAGDNYRVQEVTYKVGDNWWAAPPRDGLFDSQYEYFSLTVPLDKNGAATVEIRLRDLAGNVLAEKVVWPKPAAPAKESAPAAKPAPKR